MILPDHEIRDHQNLFNTGLIKLYDESRLQPASYDLSLGNEYRTFEKSNIYYIDPKNNESTILSNLYEADSDSYFIIHPGNFIIASTQETITLPDFIAGKVEGKSSLARLGLLVHTAGFIDPGFSGTITLEMSNHSGLPIKLYVGMAICQIAFHYLNSPCQKPYGSKELNSKYQNQDGPTESRIYRNFNDK